MAFAIFLPAALLCWRGLRAGWIGVALVLVLAVGFRAACVTPGETPPLSTDLHRYAWDARVQAAGINPYRYRPTAPELEHLRDDTVWPGINLPTWRTVYPPGAEASFLAARAAFGDRLGASTLLFLLAEAGAVALLLVVLARMPSRPPLERVALFAWHPLGDQRDRGQRARGCAGDSRAGRPPRSVAGPTLRPRGLAVAVAAVAKLGPILLVPALARRGRWPFVLVAATVGVLAYLPYISVGLGVFGDLQRYVERQRFGGSLWWALEPGLGATGATAACALVLALVVGVVSLREHDSIEQVARSCLLVLGALLLCVSYVQPWHALWLLPFFAIVPAPAWLWLTGTLPLLYLFALDWESPGWVRAVVYGGFVVTAIVARFPTSSGAASHCAAVAADFRPDRRGDPGLERSRCSPWSPP